MSAFRLSRPAALALLLLATMVGLFVTNAQWIALMSPPPPDSNGEYTSVVAIGAIVGLIYAMSWGATALGVLALWNALRDEPLRHPLIAFAIGLIAFVGTQAMATKF